MDVIIIHGKLSSGSGKGMEEKRREQELAGFYTGVW